MDPRTPSSPQEPGPEELALEYIQQRSDGEATSADRYLARLSREEDRVEFRSLVEALSRTERELPKPPRALKRELLVAGRYELVRQIGVGGMGQVWEARDRELGRRVAIKFLEAASQGRSDREEMFRKESRLLASLQHPGIVAVHEFGQDADLTYIVMDLVEGRSLSTVLDNARNALARRGEAPLPKSAELLETAIGLPLPQGRTSLLEGTDWYRSVGRIMLELVRILEAAHGQRVIHRDLKPSNVMLLGGGNPVVLDFGLAGSLDLVQGAVTQGLYGSVAYLAPEQAMSQTVGRDPRTDVYQLGLILYELLTLKRAFPGNAIGDVLERIRHGQFPLPRKLNPAVPRELEAVALMAMEVEPARRYPSARELREDLERWLGGKELPLAARAGKLRILVRRAQWYVRQRPWLVGAAGLALTSVAGSAWYLLRDQPDPLLVSMSGTALRYDRSANKPEPLPTDGLMIAKSDYLGFRIHSEVPVHVWALSVYGEDAEHLRVFPWRAATPANPDRLGSQEGPWELALPPGENVVFGTEIGAQPSPNESLLLLASADSRPELERWCEDLFQRQRAENSDGVEWDTARTMGANTLLKGRGMGPGTQGARELSDAERAAIKLAFESAPGSGTGKWIDLPGVEEFQVRCKTR